MTFYQSVYEVVKKIPKGKVATYGQIACAIGHPRASRVVGQALHHNKDPQNVPCYRVVNREGRLADEFVFGGKDVQRARLEDDGIKVGDDFFIIDFSDYLVDLSEILI